MGRPRERFGYLGSIEQHAYVSAISESRFRSWGLIVDHISSRRSLCNVVLGATISHFGEADYTVLYIQQAPGAPRIWCSSSVATLAPRVRGGTKAVTTRSLPCQNTSTGSSMLGISHRGKSSSEGLAISIRHDFLLPLVEAMEMC